MRSPGADRAVDHTKESFCQTGQIYDIIFDAVGKMPYSRCESALAPRGVYLTAVPMPETMLHMLRTPVVDGRKIGFAAPGLMRARRKQRDLIFVTELVEAGEIKSFMDRIYPLKQIAEAHRYVEKGHKKGNVVITVGDDSEAPRGEA